MAIIQLRSLYQIKITLNDAKPPNSDYKLLISFYLLQTVVLTAHLTLVFGFALLADNKLEMCFIEKYTR